MASRVQLINYLMRWVIAVFLTAGLIWREAAASATGWTYYNKDDSGPENWSRIYSDCGGRLQSPINVITNQVVYNRYLRPFDFSDYGITENIQMKLKNVGGHTAQVSVSGRELFLRGGNLPDDFAFVQVHFHWGFNGSRGSEHTIDGRAFPLEAHFVHRQRRFPNITVAASKPFGLAVVGLLFKEGNKNDNYEQLLQHLDQIEHADDEVDIPTFALKDLLPSTNFDFYRYQGSLTTPPCYESVIWSIAVNTVEISKEQIQRFRSLYDAHNHPLVDDYRPLQPIDQRTVTTTKKSGSGDCDK